MRHSISWLILPKHWSEFSRNSIYHFKSDNENWHNRQIDREFHALSKYTVAVQKLIGNCILRQILIQQIICLSLDQLWLYVSTEIWQNTRNSDGMQNPIEVFLRVDSDIVEYDIDCWKRIYFFTAILVLLYIWTWFFYQIIFFWRKWFCRKIRFLILWIMKR